MDTERKEDIDNPQNLSSGTASHKSTGTAVEAAVLKEPTTTAATTSLLSPENVQDGSVILGAKQSGNVYTTRYAINRRRQREDICGEIVQEAFCPCTLEENRTSIGKALWAVISSETLVFGLHITVLVFGVAKEALNLREVDEDLYLVHSLIETFVTILLIAIRVNTARVQFRSLRYHITGVEHVEDTSSASVRGKALRKWLLVYYVMAALLLVIPVTCFLLFFFLLHLG